MIQLSGLRKEFDNLLAVDNLSVTIPAGEIYGLIGPNGAGKTTTLRIACGLLEPTGGQVRINDVDVLADPEQARRHIGYLSDFFSVYEDLKVWEYLDYFAHAYKMPAHEIPGRVEEVIAEAGLESKRDTLIHGLSRGMKQRLGIARAMIHKPKVLLLDEPASGLDPKARIELRNLLRATRDQGSTILISSHILTELEGLCTSIGIMERGRLIRTGKIEEVVAAGIEARLMKLQWIGDHQRGIQDLLSTFPAITEIRLNTTEADFRFTGTEEEQAQLLAQLIAQGVRVTTFREIRQTVEEMYMKLSTHEVM